MRSLLFLRFGFFNRAFCVNEICIQRILCIFFGNFNPIGLFWEEGFVETTLCFFRTTTVVADLVLRAGNEGARLRSCTNLDSLKRKNNFPVRILEFSKRDCSVGRGPEYICISCEMLDLLRS